MLLFTLIIGWILFGCEMDLFVPSLPELQTTFNISPFMVELTLGTNFTAHCIACIIIGSLGDRLGYRPVIIGGAIVFVLGSIFCTYANSFNVLLFGRFLQGAGIAGITTLSYLVLTDIYSIQKQQEILGWLNGVIAIVMAVAPVVGSYICLLFHWRGNFVALLIIGIINLALSYIFIPKSTPKNDATLSFFDSYKIIFQSKKTMYYVYATCATVAPYWIFSGIAPILYMESLGVSLSEFGFYQGMLALIFGICSFGNSFFIRKFGTKKCVYFGIYLTILFLILCAIAIVLKVSSPLIITLIMIVLSIAETIPSNIVYPLMFEILPDSKGKTSAVLTAIRMILITFGVQIAGYFYDGTFIPIGIITFLITASMLLFMYLLFIVENEQTKLS